MLFDFSGLSVLITGGTGTFGRSCSKFLLEFGAKRVAILSRGEHAQAEMSSDFNSDSRLRFFIGDVRDRERLRRAFDGVDIVLHAAALKRIEVGHYNPEEMIKTNVLGALNVIEAARDAGVKKVVFLSTDKAVEPISPYGKSKAIAEDLFLAANDNSGARGPQCSVCRYGNIWGSNGSVVPKWRKMISEGKTSVPVTDMRCTRFYMTPSQAVELVLSTAMEKEGGKLNTPVLPAYSLGDLILAMRVSAEVIGLPKWEKMHESMRLGETSEHARRMSIDELRVALAQ